MTSVTIVLAAGLLGLGLLSAWLYTSLRKANDELSRLKRSATSNRVARLVDPAGLISPLIRDQDPLGNMLRFMYNHKQGTATTRQGYEACELLLDTMASSWGLRATDGYRSVVAYDPEQHRISDGARATKGQRVVVIEPGWKLANEPLKYPFVKTED